MENKITFGFDRKINNIWIPNGYPLVLNDFFTDTSEYFDKTGKWPAVYPLGVIPYENVDRKLISDIDDKSFLYYVEQFGAIGKVIGEDEGYESSGFLNNMLETTKQKLRKKQGVIMIVAHTESTIELKSIIHLHNSLVKEKISPNIVGYVMGNNWSIGIEYDDWCKANNIKEKVSLVNCYEQLHNKGYQLLNENQNDNTFVSEKEFYESKNKIREHQLICFNRRIRPHRYAMIAMLHHNNLLKNNLVSFSLETGKDLNCMGDKGFPDIDTMRKICGNRELMETYLSYFDELNKMSPRTIDYEKLENVLGTGNENKSPYLNSYFSIVTETGFPEPSRFATEKVFRPILHFHPFIVYGSEGTLSMLRDLGFKTFSPFIDESYDNEKTTFRRMQKITKEVNRICSMSKEDIHKWYYKMEDILIHNRELIKKYGKNYHQSQKKVIVDLYEKLRRK